MDLLGRHSLVFAIIPFHQVSIDNHLLAESSKFAGLSCPPHRTAEGAPRKISGKDWPHPFREPAAMIGQRDVRGPGVLATEAPLGFTVPDREDVHVRLLESQALSASVDRTGAEAASRPHRQPVISGMSSPYWQINCLWSMSLSRIACLA